MLVIWNDLKEILNLLDVYGNHQAVALQQMLAEETVVTKIDASSEYMGVRGAS